MNLVVADNTPISLLCEIGLIDLLPSLYDRVIITTAILNELRDPASPEYVWSFANALPAWVNIQDPGVAAMIPGLDLGESTAIRLAEELRCDLLIDERRGRAYAKQAGIPRLGSIGFLELAANSGQLSDLADCHDRIRLSSFYFSEPVLQESLKRHIAFQARS